MYLKYVVNDNEVSVVNEKGDKLGYCTFPSIGQNLVVIDHTVVAQELRGQGIASKLLDKAYEAIKKTNRKAYATCSYAQKYFEKNPDKKDILK